MKLRNILQNSFWKISFFCNLSSRVRSVVNGEVGGIALCSLHHALAAAIVVVIILVVHLLFLLACGAFGFHVSETVCECGTETTSAVSVFCVAHKVLVACDGVPSARIEKVAYIKAYAQMLVEVFAQSEVYRVVGLAVSLCHYSFGVVASSGLHGDGPRKNDACCHSGVPREIFVAFARDCLVGNVIAESVELVVEEVQGGGEVYLL